MADDLVGRVLSAITEREQKAEAARTNLWGDADEPERSDGVWLVEDGIVTARQSGTVAACTLDDYEHTRMRPEDAEHIAGNDPRSVLRLCQAHRDLIEEHSTRHVVSLDKGLRDRGHPMTRTGWFSDVDRDAAPTDRYQWQPCLQLDGMCFSFDVWFASREDCDDFILREVIGRPFLDAIPGEVASANAAFPQVSSEEDTP